MNENGTKRRDWVKNAAIVFLSVMLVLTFFSNTIMNYSLPEVAAQYITPGTITSKIRGSGVVESADPYNVQINETRTVESVLVSVGTTVQKGDPLFLLAEKESSELKAAEDTLKDMMLQYELQILSGSISSNAITNVQSGSVLTVAQYQEKIVAAEAEIEKYKGEVEYAEREIAYLSNLQNQVSNSVPDTSAEQQKLAAANAALAADPYNQAFSKVNELNARIAECDQVIAKYNERVIVDYEEDTSSGTAVMVPVYEVSEAEYMKADANRTNYLSQKAALDATLNDADAKAQYEKLQKEVAQARTDLTNKENSPANDSAAIARQLGNWNLELTARRNNLNAAEAAKSQLLSDIAATLNLNSRMDEIKEQKALIEELKSKQSSTVIVAPISGTISSINLTAGQDTTPGSPIASMQPEGSSMSMSFTVTNEQARKLSVGMQADLVNYWRYDDVVVTLNRIIPDPSNPSQSKKLVFGVTGSVIAGQTLNVSVGDRSADYDMTVPNSAIREDSNGKFILLVEVKSSPLGNRYKAARADVEILASDDTHSAISGAFESYGYVITTATKPVAAGQLIRLAEQ